MIAGLFFACRLSLTSSDNPDKASVYLLKKAGFVRQSFISPKYPSNNAILLRFSKKLLTLFAGMSIMRPVPELAVSHLTAKFEEPLWLRSSAG
ncbi:hypothetical protein [Photobacterium kagoshimensis]|uniref:hypothetical protein n=1 Tax=Photobacterium kagoshimensis TaxID=2910242 RepID=UPI003D13DE1E